MVETAAEPCPGCGEVIEFGIPQNKNAVKSVGERVLQNDKSVECHECGTNFDIRFK